MLWHVVLFSGDVASDRYLFAMRNSIGKSPFKARPSGLRYIKGLPGFIVIVRHPDFLVLLSVCAAAVVVACPATVSEMSNTPGASASFGRNSVMPALEEPRCHFQNLGFRV